MALPLYQELQSCEHLAKLKASQRDAGHAGLWFERFYDRYKADFVDTKTGENDFRDWLAGFKHNAGDGGMLEAAVLRQEQLADQLKGESAVFKSPWHFVSGMGYSHPLENGFSWHPVWGVPFLPGSGVKGLVRSWVEAWEYDEDCQAKDQQEAKREQLLDWFGSVDKKADDPVKQHTGKVIFFDAIPLNPVALTTDIMTPHMGKWYSEGGDIKDVDREPDKVPADWHSPKPLYFLSAKAPEFLVSVAPRNEVVAVEVDLDEVMRCVECAFEWLGAGAKTAVGYGQFERDDKQTQERKDEALQRQQQLAEEREQAEALSGLEGAALALMQCSQRENWRDNKNAFLGFPEQEKKNLEYWLEALASDPHPVALSYLRELFELHFSEPDLLSDPEAINTRGKKSKPEFRPRPKALGLRFLEIERSIK